MATLTRAKETATVKAALKREGIPFLRVSHGTGTALVWIQVKLPEGTYRQIGDRAERIVARVTGRGSWSENCILVHD